MYLHRFGFPAAIVLQETYVFCNETPIKELKLKRKAAGF
jgi:hypothetical protein